MGDTGFGYRNSFGSARPTSSFDRLVDRGPRCTNFQTTAQRCQARACFLPVEIDPGADRRPFRVVLCEEIFAEDAVVRSGGDDVLLCGVDVAETLAEAVLVQHRA